MTLSPPDEQRVRKRAVVEVALSGELVRWKCCVLHCDTSVFVYTYTFIDVYDSHNSSDDVHRSFPCVSVVPSPARVCFACALS